MAALVSRKRAVETSPRRRMKSGGLRAKAWWIIRNRGTATIDSLLNTLNDNTQKDAESNLRKYFQALVQAGILKVEIKRQPGTALTSNGYHRYVLLIDCGIDAPVWRKTLNEVYCPGSGAIYKMKNPEAPAKPVSPKRGGQ